MDTWSPKYSPSPPLHRTRPAFRSGPGGKGPRGLPVGEIVLIDPLRVPQRPQRRSNSLDDDSGSSGGTEADLPHCWIRPLPAVRSQRGTRRDLLAVQQASGRPDGLAQDLISSGGLQKRLFNVNEGGVMELSSDERGLREISSRHIHSEDLIGSVDRDLTYQSELVPLPSRKKTTTWCRTRRSKVLADRAKCSTPSRGLGGCHVLGRSMSDSPCYLQARNIVNSSKSVTTRSLQEDFPVTTEQSVIEDSIPPLPPRDYPVKVRRNVPPPPPPPPPQLPPPLPPHQRQHVEIHPIVMDGKKLSDTHYFLLETKLSPSELNLASNREEYVNIRSAGNDLLTVCSDAAAAQLRFSPEKSEVNSPGQQRGAIEGLHSFLSRTGIGWCLGRNRKLRRSQSDSERHLLTGSAESGLDAGDRSSIDSAPCCVETGYANRGLDTSNDEQSLAGSVNEYSNRDLDTSGSDQSLANVRYRLADRDLDIANDNLLLASTSNGHANRDLDCKSPGHSFAERTETCRSPFRTHNGCSESNERSSSFLHHARNKSVNDQLLFTNNHVNHELNALRTNNNDHFSAGNAYEYSNRALDTSNDRPLAVDTYSRSKADSNGFTHTNHPRLDSTRSWNSLGESSATSPSWTLEDGMIKQKECRTSGRHGCYNGVGDAEGRSDIAGYSERASNGAGVRLSEEHTIDQLGCCSRAEQVRSCACTKGAHCNCSSMNKTVTSVVDPSLSGTSSQRTLLRTSNNVQNFLDDARGRARLVDRLMALQVGSREECLKSLVETSFDLDRAADRLLSGKASCV